MLIIDHIIIGLITTHTITITTQTMDIIADLTLVETPTHIIH